MSRRDIDVDESELFRFIQVLEDFQERAREKFQGVSFAWNKCNESWQGDSKKQFEGQFEVTSQSVEKTLDAGDDALKWLERFDEIVREFERNF